jgi:hypothetical protein
MTPSGLTAHREFAAQTEAIAAEIAAQLSAVGGVTVDVVSLLSDGRISQWREAYDLKSMLD